MSKPSSPSDPGKTGKASSGAGAGVKSGAGPSAPAPPQRPPSLRLLALDSEDLTIFSAHLQDAVVRVRDMAFVPRSLRFVLIVNRFEWTHASHGLPASEATPNRQAGTHSFERRRCAIRFERVRRVQTSGFSQKDKRQVLSLLSIGFEQARDGDPDGTITIVLAGGGAIRLDVECVEAELRDLGAGWRAAARPDHPES